LCRKDDRTDCNNYLDITIINYTHTTLSHTLLSILTAYVAERVLNQEYGFGWNLCKGLRALFHVYVLFHVIMQNKFNMFQMTYKKPSSGEIRIQNRRYHVNYIKTIVM
jgi:hypothetical protein